MRFLKWCLSFSSPRNLLLFTSNSASPTVLSQVLSVPLVAPTSSGTSLFSSACSLPLLRLSFACVPPSSITSRLRVVDPPDVRNTPSSRCPPCWIRCLLQACLFSPRRHCCCCCSSWLLCLLVHPSVLRSFRSLLTSFRLHKSLSAPLQSAFDGCLCVLVSPSP